MPRAPLRLLALFAAASPAAASSSTDGTTHRAVPPPPATWTDVVNAPDTLSRMRAYTAFALTAAPKQIMDALPSLDAPPPHALPPDVRSHAAFRLGQGLAQRHPVFAVATLTDPPSAPLANPVPFRAGLFAGLGQAAPNLALPFLTAPVTATSPASTDALRAFFAALASHHPERVEAALEACPDAAGLLLGPFTSGGI